MTYKIIEKPSDSTMIQNKDLLCKNTSGDKNICARKIALSLLEAGLSAADPYLCIKNTVKITDRFLKIGDKVFEIDDIDKIYVVGGGKASGYMAVALEDILGKYIYSGFVSILKGTKSKYKTKKINLSEASHPLPDSNSIKNARKILKIVENAGEKDLVICLLSGGGSSLLCAPAGDITLEDKRETTSLLLRSGATIQEINTVRKHISDIKGGQLAETIYPATTVSLILSDVVGDPVQHIVSGPTAPDTTTFTDAKKILEKYSLIDKLPHSIIKHIELGIAGRIDDTPDEKSDIFNNVFNIIIGSNTVSLKNIKENADRDGLNSIILTSYLQGESRYVGKIFAGIARTVVRDNFPLPPPCAIISGGETTVTVKGNGKGGRNQELVLGSLSALQEYFPSGVVICSLASDGIDGKSDAAGAIIDSSTLDKTKKLGLDIDKYLKENDSYSFFRETGDIIFTGATGTNVNDFTLIIVL